MLGESTPMKTTPNHLLGQLGMHDILETDERMVMEMANRPELTNTRAPCRVGWSRR